MDPRALQTTDHRPSATELRTCQSWRCRQSLRKGYLRRGFPRPRPAALPSASPDQARGLRLSPSRSTACRRDPRRCRTQHPSTPVAIYTTALVSTGACSRSGPCRSPCTGASGARAGSGPCRSPCTGASGARAGSGRPVPQSVHWAFLRPCLQWPVPQSLHWYLLRPCSQFAVVALLQDFIFFSLDFRPSSRIAACRFLSLASCSFADSPDQIVSHLRNWSTAGGTACAVA
jgi:hypothetical protein